MSAYGKPQPAQIHGYDTGRPSYPEHSFPYPQPVYTSTSQSSVPTTPAYQNATQLTQMAYPPNQSRASYDEQTGPYLNVGSTPVPQVTSYNPSRGARDSKFYVYITSLYDLMTSNTPIFFLMFGQRKCQANLQKSTQQGAVCSYVVTADVPPFSTISWQASQVPVTLFMETGDGDVIAKVDVGDFTYLDSGINTPQDVSKKRKLSADSSDMMKSPQKRSTSQALRPKEEYGTYGYTHSDSFTSSPYLQPSHSYGSLGGQYSRASYQSQSSARHLAYGYSTSATASPPTLKAQSPQVGTWNSGYPPMGSNMVRSPGITPNACVPRPAMSSLPASGVLANPPLIRTSTLQQTPSPGSTPHGGHPGQPFNAYTLYPHKAKLEINGDLEAMAQNWTEEEFEARRRLVHFRRSQSGSTITTTFQPVSAEDRPPNSVCISCIYWEERNECFVTSVDTIFLLEQLVAARFTVEEKNRIRRNLEGFRPLTVSKGKTDSEEFFKVIMAFPSPKPRNIEKDVKVFHWKDLASALKKIIGKYSASPSSTLGPALLTPVSSTGYPADVGTSYPSGNHGTMSPRSISGSTTSTAYTSNIPARVVSPHNQKAMPLQGGPPDLRVSISQNHNPHEGPSHWQGGQHHMQGAQQYQQLANPSSGRGSWDMSNYLESTPTTPAGPSTPQNASYPSSRSLADTAVPGGDDRIARTLSQQSQSQQQQQQQQNQSQQAQRS